MKCQVHSKLDSECQFTHFLANLAIHEASPIPLFLEVSGNSFCIFHLPNDTHAAGCGIKSNWNDDLKKQFSSLLEQYQEWCENHEKDFILDKLHSPVDIELYNKSLPAISLDNVNVRGTFNLHNVTTTKYLSCVGAHFQDSFTASNCLFKSASFNESRFGSYVDFSNSVFMDGTLFRATKFLNQATFSGAEFDGVDFQDAEFSNTDFSGAVFKGNCSFRNAIFTDSLCFDYCEFETIADFSTDKGLTFGSKSANRALRNDVRFVGTNFESSVSFDNRIFSSGADFSEAIFGRAPTFFNCRHHEDTKFPVASSFVDRSPKAINVYTNLKLAMSNLKRAREEGMFYALEQESLRNDSTTPKSAKLASLFYEKISDYGQNFVRPLYWWFGSLGVFWLLYSAITWTSDARMVDVLSFTLKQSVFPFSAWRVELFGELGIWNSWQILQVRVLASIQSAFSLGLITMSLLALRWRFRRH